MFQTGGIRERGAPIKPGRRLRVWRTLKDLDPYEICAVVGVGHSTLMRYERGTRQPSESVKATLYKEFGFRW